MEQTDQFLRRTFGRFLLPTVLSMLGGTVNVMVDGIIVGNRLGELGLAAINLCSPVYLILCTLGSLIATGTGILASVAIGASDPDEGQRYYTRGVWLLAGLGAAVTLLGLLLLDPIVALLGADQVLFPLVRAYVKVTLWGAIPKMLLYIPFQYLRLDGRMRENTLLLVSMVLLNTGLDLLFLGPLALGMAGAALASVLATALAAFGGFCLLGQARSGFHLRPAPLGAACLRSILKMGSPAALNNFLSAVRLICLNLILLSLGGNGLVSVFTLVNSMSEFSLSLVSGVPQTAAPLLGVYYGERDTHSIRRLMRRQFLTGGLLAAVFGLGVILLARPLCAVFGLTDPALVAVAVPALRLFGCSVVLAMCSNILLSFYNTTGRVALANIMTVCRVFLFAVGSVLLLARTGSVTAVWLFCPLADALTLALVPLLALAVRRRDPSLSPLYLLDERLEREGRTLNFSVPNGAGQAALASERISGFCEDNGLSPKQSMAMSLALEEMLTLIFDHCFSQGADQSVDVRAFCVSGVVGLRLRNGGAQFDPIRYYREHEDDAGMEDTLGIKLITGIAQLVTWRRTFGVNTLQIYL